MILAHQYCCRSWQVHLWRKDFSKAAVLRAKGLVKPSRGQSRYDVPGRFPSGGRRPMTLGLEQCGMLLGKFDFYRRVGGRSRLGTLSPRR